MTCIKLKSMTPNSVAKRSITFYKENRKLAFPKCTLKGCPEKLKENDITTSL